MTDDGGSSPRPPPPGRSRRDKGKAKVREPTAFASGDDQSDRDSSGPGSRNNPLDGRETEVVRVPIIPRPCPLNNPSDGLETEVVRVVIIPRPCPLNNPSDGRETEVVRVPIIPRPRPLFMSRVGICLKLTLSSFEVLEPHPKLNLSSDEASLLTGCEEILKDPPIRFSGDIVVFDASDKRYDMNISNHDSGSLNRFLVNTEWQQFVLAEQMKEHYEVVFYRFSDYVSGQIYYRLEFFKIPESRPRTRPRNVPRPGKSSDLADDDEDCWLSRTLTSHEVDPTNPVIYLDPEDAYYLTGCGDLLQLPSASCSKTLHVSDDIFRTYNLQLSPFFENQDWAGYSISGDWRVFVRANNLEARDRILFYNHSFNDDTHASGCYYYEIKIVRKEPALAEVKVYNKEESTDRNFHLRVIPDDTMCLEKTLLGLEGVHNGGKPRLFLDASGAGLLLGCPDIYYKYPVGKLRENLIVFDADNRQYDMLLSNFETLVGDVLYTVDAGWQRFVKIHNLTAGDTILFYRFIDETVKYQPFYLVRYIRNNLLPVSGVGPSGSGHKEEV